MPRSFWLLLLLSALAWATAQTATSADAPAWKAQVQRGQILYLSTCAICHGDDQQGVSAPALRGEDFQATYTRAPVVLHDYIRDFMPEDRPASLKPQEVLDVTAYLLDVNGVNLPEAGLTAGNITK